MEPKLTIAYVTSRIDPRFAWFADTLARELRSMPTLAVQVLVIDTRLWYDDARRAELSAAVQGRFATEHVEPKPSVWQGPHRRTRQDWFCAAGARNTALALARAPHVAFVDDLSALLPGWLDAHRQAAEGGYVLAGLTHVHEDVSVSGDGHVTWREGRPDSRVFSGDAVECSGAHLYGGTFSVPLDVALKVNGVDEIHEGIGGEDYDFGIRLERTGVRMRISRACVTVEDGPAHHDEAIKLAERAQHVRRLDMWWDLTHPEARDWRRAENGWAEISGERASDALMARLRRDASRRWTTGNAFDLRELRRRVLAGEAFPVPSEPTHRWVDGCPLEEVGA